VPKREREYAVDLVHSICCLAGNPSYVDEIRSDLRAIGIVRAISAHDTPRLFDWLVLKMSYQGIGDQIVETFIEKHGNVRWQDIDRSLASSPTCPKLNGYWMFHECRYQKGSVTCAEPGHLAACPLPSHPLRNGNLNQLAYSLRFWIRDVADGDLVGWIDDQLAAVNPPGSATDLAASRDALIAPLRNVYGVSDRC
jgi:hypothetical protein